MRFDLSILVISIYIYIYVVQVIFNYSFSGLISYAEYLFLLTILTSKYYIFKIHMRIYSAANTFPGTASDIFSLLIFYSIVGLKEQLCIV